jgi:uncharacterized membrane protein YjgN (DUF898 family)
MSNSHSNDGDAIDYTNYSLDELKQALDSIDENVYSERAQVLRELITKRSPHTPQHNTEPSDSNPIERIGINDQIISKERVKFHGNGTEFFAIWIVNLLLSIVTLGIYSAWATVRTNRYFYSNTEIGGHRLAYLAEPIQILIGRLIAFALFAVFVISTSFSPIVAVVASILFALVVPVIIVMGVRFRMRMMAYRNVRFNFTSRIGRAYVVFLLFPILGVMSLYLAMPWVLKKIDEFLYENMTYGDKEFTPQLSAAEYYIAVIVSAVIGFFGVFLIGIVVAVIIGGFGASMGGDFDPDNLAASAGFFIGMLFAFVLYGFIIVVAYSFFNAYIRNHIYNNTKINDVAIFASDLKVMDLVLLSITNYLMLLFTLGLAYPWVKVRTTRLLTRSTEISILAGIDDVVAKSGGNENAVADEVIGAFDIDVSLG